MMDMCEELTQGNNYTTTLHLINSAIIKLSKITQVAIAWSMTSPLPDHSLVIPWSFRGHSLVIPWSMANPCLVILRSFPDHSLIIARVLLTIDANSPQSIGR